VQLGALDIEPAGGGLAAIIPDSVSPDAVAAALGVAIVTVSSAVGRDNDSIWLLSPPIVRIGRVSGALRLKDSTAFGTGHHPTTKLCIEALEAALQTALPDRVLDVGTGSGILALAALTMGVPKAVGLDIDAGALEIAAENAILNNLGDRLELVPGGPEAVNGVWPLVVANVLAAPLIEMAPVLVRRVGNGGRLILSGIPSSLESEVRRTYERLGMRYVRSESRDAWAALVMQATW
jgi:ribosomal protein L11 methyltransferase